MNTYALLETHDDELHEEVVEVARVDAVPQCQVDERGQLRQVLVAHPLEPLEQVSEKEFC